MQSAEHQEAVGLSQRAVYGVVVCIPFIIGFLGLGGSALMLGAVALLLSGMATAALLVFSWRHYHPYLSWLIWAVPGAALVMVVFQLFIGPLISSGAVSVFVAELGLFGCAGLGYFATLVALRGYISRNLGPDGT